MSAGHPQTTMYCMICGAVAPCDAHTYHGQAPCRSNPMPETTYPSAPMNDREFAVWEHGRIQGHNEAKREIERLRLCKAGTSGTPMTDQTTREQRYEEALQRIADWSAAYPYAVFPKPDLKRAHEVLTAAGMTLDAISADAMRHVVEGVGEIARKALSGTEP